VRCVGERPERTGESRAKATIEGREENSTRMDEAVDERRTQPEFGALYTVNADRE
jgi:hypothetical protein